MTAGDEYVPTTGDVRSSDLPSTEDVRFTYAAEREVQTGIRSTQWGRQFDAWLAAHDAEVRADERAQVRQRYADALAQDDMCGYNDAFGIAASRVTP